jgi:hypothetical protein
MEKGRSFKPLGTIGEEIQIIEKIAHHFKVHKDGYLVIDRKRLKEIANNHQATGDRHGRGGQHGEMSQEWIRSARRFKLAAIIVPDPGKQVRN